MNGESSVGIFNSPASFQNWRNREKKIFSAEVLYNDIENLDVIAIHPQELSANQRNLRKIVFEKDSPYISSFDYNRRTQWNNLQYLEECINVIIGTENVRQNKRFEMICLSH